jgi:hypothetical protein
VISGVPSVVLGAGAERFGLPSRERGIPGMGWRHCITGGALMASAARVIKRAFKAFLLLSMGFCANYYRAERFTVDRNSLRLSFS